MPRLQSSDARLVRSFLMSADNTTFADHLRTTCMSKPPYILA
ncbi:hypothetical protein PspLS_08979 [Pyricularia sp. CBS 133598]|nr:hypothetical protein PspLS_08979 [Pyricularia sp. CBS 133598]